MTIMCGFHMRHKPISRPAATARTLIINMPFTLRDRKRQKGDRGRYRERMTMDMSMGTGALFLIDPGLTSNLRVFSHDHFTPISPLIALILLHSPSFLSGTHSFHRTFILSLLHPCYFILPSSPPFQVSHKSHQEGGKHTANGEDCHRQ